MKQTLNNFTSNYRLCQLCLLVFFLCTQSYKVKAQCDGIYINSYIVTPISLRSVAEVRAGATAERYITVQINTTQSANCSNWSLGVRARDNWRSGNSVINLQNTSIRFNSTVGGPTGREMGLTGAPYPLALNQTMIITRSTAAINTNLFPYFDIKYDLIINPASAAFYNNNNGDYSTILEFVLYDNSGRALSTSSVRAVFNIHHDANNSSIINLQNGASNIVLAFNTPSDFTNGIIDRKLDGLSINAFTPHQVIVKASGNRLMAPGVTQGIPVSAIQLSLSTSNNSQPSITCTPISLSENAKVVANNPMPNYGYQSVVYNLRFSIAGNNPNIVSAEPGVYSTNIIFILVPN